MRHEQPDRVKLEISSVNLGFAAGVNRGIEAILGRWAQAWIFLVNNDAEVLPGAIDALRATLQAAPNAVVAYPGMQQGASLFGLTYYQPLLGLFATKQLPGSIRYPSGCALLIAPERIELPLFDEDFFMYGEDVMLGARLGPQRMAHVPEILVRHTGNAGSGQGSAFTRNALSLRTGCWRANYPAHGPNTSPTCSAGSSRCRRGLRFDLCGCAA